MAKLHRKTTDEHPVLEHTAAGARELLRFAKGRSLLRVDACIEAATDLEKWEAEGGAVGGSIEYCTALFDKPTIERMTGHFKRLVSQFTADLDQPVGLGEPRGVGRQ